MAHVDGPLTADGTALMNTVQQFFGAIAMTILATIVSMTQAGLTSANPGFCSGDRARVFIGFIVVAVIVAAALGLELVAMRHSRITSGTQAITAEEIIEADEIEAAVLAEMGDSAQVSVADTQCVTRSASTCAGRERCAPLRRPHRRACAEC